MKSKNIFNVKTVDEQRIAYYVPLDKLFCKRKITDHERVDHLKESISKHGVRVDIEVRRVGVEYEIIDGLYRSVACLRLNHVTIPAIIVP